jgi:hypothetical protein
MRTMAEQWRTNPNNPGHYPRCKMQEGFRKDGVPPRGIEMEEDGEPTPRCDHDRYCVECGKEVCVYKDAHMDKVWCYAHDFLTPWTRPYLVGPGGVARNQWYNQETEREERYE